MTTANASMYELHLEAANRNLQAEVERLQADLEHLAQVVAQQSARLERQARGLSGVRAAIGPHLEAHMWQCPCCAAVGRALDGER